MVELDFLRQRGWSRIVTSFVFLSISRISYLLLREFYFGDGRDAWVGHLLMVSLGLFLRLGRTVGDLGGI